MATFLPRIPARALLLPPCIAMNKFWHLSFPFRTMGGQQALWSSQSFYHRPDISLDTIPSSRVLFYPETSQWLHSAKLTLREPEHTQVKTVPNTFQAKHQLEHVSVPTTAMRTSGCGRAETLLDRSRTSECRIRSWEQHQAKTCCCRQRGRQHHGQVLKGHQLPCAAFVPAWAWSLPVGISANPSFKCMALFSTPSLSAGSYVQPSAKSFCLHKRVLWSFPVAQGPCKCHVLSRQASIMKSSHKSREIETIIKSKPLCENNKPITYKTFREASF